MGLCVQATCALAGPIHDTTESRQKGNGQNSLECVLVVSNAHDYPCADIALTRNALL